MSEIIERKRTTLNIDIRVIEAAKGRRDIIMSEVAETALRIKLGWPPSEEERTRTHPLKPRGATPSKTENNGGKSPNGGTSPTARRVEAITTALRDIGIDEESTFGEGLVKKVILKYAGGDDRTVRNYGRLLMTEGIIIPTKTGEFMVGRNW